MKTKYCAILFHPSGDYVTDFQRETIDEIWEEVADMGSRWIFYPIVMITNGTSIVSTCEGAEWLNRKRIKTVVSFLEKEWETRAEKICDGLNNGTPLNFIYS